MDLRVVFEVEWWSSSRRGCCRNPWFRVVVHAVVGVVVVEVVVVKVVLAVVRTWFRQVVVAVGSVRCVVLLRRVVEVQKGWLAEVVG